LGNLAARLPDIGNLIAGFLRSMTIKTFVVFALWALFLVWNAWGVVANGAALLFKAGPAGLFQVSYAAPLFTMNLWGCAAALAFGLGIINPFAWLNGRRMVVTGLAFAMILGRLAGSGLAGRVPGSETVAIGLLTTPLALLLGGAAIIFTLGLIGGAAFSLFVGIPVMIFNQIFSFERSLHIYRYRAGGLAGYIVRAMLWLRNEQAGEAPPEDSKGARFATAAEMIALHRPDDAAAMAFGHSGNPLFIKTDKHILIMASTRSGKGVSLIIPHLLRYRGSAFVLDPKGENAKATIRQRSTLNGKVHVLDPFGITGLPQARFNPLSRFTPENMEAESKALAAAMFIVGDRERDHWTASGQQLLAAIILYVYVSPNVPPEKKDLPTVRRHLLGGVMETLNTMKEMHDADDLLSDLAISFLETPEREFGSIISTAQRQTEILDNPFIIACLSATGPGEEVDFKAWKAGTMTVYLCLSAPKFPTFNRWLRLVLTSALDEMTETLEPPPLPICFMLDELATLGHLQTVENAVGLSAGYGIQLICVFQDTAQMEDLYKGRWASFIGNAGVRALFNLDDFNTAEYWSKFVGDRLVETRNQQQDIYGYSKGDSVGESMRRLLSPDQIMMDFASRNDSKNSDKMLILAQGAHPLMTDRVPYFNDRGLTGLWDDPRRPVSARQLQPPRPTPPPATPPAAGPTAPPPPAPSPEAASTNDTSWDGIPYTGILTLEEQERQIVQWRTRSAEQSAVKTSPPAPPVVTQAAAPTDDKYISPVLAELMKTPGPWSTQEDEPSPNSEPPASAPEIVSEPTDPPDASPPRKPSAKRAALRKRS
jgi:type IV secretion system protein VirD4